MTVDVAISRRWHHIWFWLAWAYEKNGKRLTALQRADTGLAAAPHDLALLKMKARVLSVLWREDRSHFPAARTFFLFCHEAFPDEGDATAELARIHAANGEEEAAWTLVNEFFGPPANPSAATYLRTVGCSLEEVLLSVRFLASYGSFRQTKPHRSLLRPLHDGGIATGKAFENELLVVLSVPFGLAWREVLKTPRPQRDSHTVDALYGVLTEQLGRLLPRTAESLAGQVRGDNVETLTDGLSRVIVVLREIALYEVSWQMGYIAGALGIPAPEMEKVYPIGEKLNEWLGQVSSNTFMELNRVLKIVPA